MARKRKNRTHLKGGEQDAPTNSVPKSIIIKHGPVGHSLAQLVRDLRKVMEPNTASRLKVPAAWLACLSVVLLKCTLFRNAHGINLKIF